METITYGSEGSGTRERTRLTLLFFMVDRRILFNRNFSSSKLCNNSDNIIITNENNNNKNEDNDKIPKYTKVYIENPFDNRKVILKVAKGQKGVYLWEDNKHSYVGHSINLYNRVSSYFMPSILKTKARRVLRYFNKHGFLNANLTLYIVDKNCSLEEIVRLEQHFINTLKPSLNVDLVASSSGYHEPMSQEVRNRLRKQRGTPIYVYNKEDFTLLHLFESKQNVYDSMNIHRITLSNCLNTGNLYLDTFFFSLDLIYESDNVNLLSIKEMKELVSNKRDLYSVKHPAATSILAEFKDDSNKNLSFPSLHSLANHLKGERSGYYRGKWKFTYKN